MNISEGRVQEAIGNARSMDATTGLINVGLFYRFLEEAVLKWKRREKWSIAWKILIVTIEWA